MAGYSQENYNEVKKVVNFYTQHIARSRIAVPPAYTDNVVCNRTCPDWRIQNVSDVEYGILETNGQLSVLLKSNKRAVTPEDLDMDLPPENFSRDIIVDGKLIGRTLERMQIKREWVDNALKEFGINDYSQVFYASINNQMTLFVQKKGE